MTKKKAGYSERVEARAALARELLKDKHRARRSEVGLLPEDLEFIAEQGREALEQDRIQREELAGQRQQMKQKLAERDRFDAEMDGLRNLLPAVIFDLKAAGKTELAGWLEQVSFERFRLRPTAVAEGKEAVAKRDRLSLTQQAVQFLASVFEPGREELLAALARRAMNRERLQALKDTAERLLGEAGGKLSLRASKATEREAQAVALQKKRWEAVRRLVRAAVAGEEKLERMFASC